MEKIIVFDFDKTLTNYDTILPFFLHCCRQNPIRYLFVPLFFLVKVLSKIGLITVKKEKEIGLHFFCPKTIQDFRILCSKFSQTLRLNNVYYNELIPLKKGNNNIVIASASFQYYLEDLFSGVSVIGTLVETDSVGKITGISQHPFQKEKTSLLQSKLKSGIHCFYTDSKNDIPTAKLSEKTIWIKKGEILSKK